MEADDWGLTAEDFDFLERDAIQKLSQRNSSSSSIPNPSPPDFNHVEIPCAPEENILKEHGKVGSAELPKLSVKLFLHSTGTIAAKFNYHPLLVAACKQIPKAAYHDKERVWVFPVLSLSKVEEVISGVKGANVEVQSLDTFVQRALRAAFTSSDLRGLYNKMPNYIESKLLPFQRDGVRFVLQHGGRALIADEMGLGKTLQAIAVAACLREHWPVLVLAPSSLRLQWASMIQEWLDIPPSDILVVLPPCGGPSKSGFKLVYSSSKNIIQLDGAFNIISYDAVQKLQDLLLASEFKIVIADESHFLKNSHAKRTTSSAPILQRARYTLLLSGTPALSRPIELFKQLEALYPDVYKNFHEYGTRYCKGGVFGMYQGASNHEELHNLMKSTLMIRRLKKDVLAELPMKRRQQVFLDLQGKGVKELKVLTRELEVIKAKMKTCGSADEAESLRLSRQSMVSRIFNESSEVKLPAVIDFLDSTVMEAPFKFLVFAHHQCMIDGIHQHLIKKKVGCIRIDGGTPSSSRQALVTEFQEKEDISAAVLSIKAGGVGLTLTAASTVIFAELSWNPGDITQAEDRAHRIGQASSVNIYYLLANDTVDDMMWNTIHNKSGNLGQMLDGHENGLEVSHSDPESDCSKQTTLDTFLRRCPGEDDGQPSKFKRPRKKN